MNARHLPESLEQFAQFAFGRLEIHIPNKEVLHFAPLATLLYTARTLSRQIGKISGLHLHLQEFSRQRSQFRFGSPWHVVDAAWNSTILFRLSRTERHSLHLDAECALQLE